MNELTGLMALAAFIAVPLSVIAFVLWQTQQRQHLAPTVHGRGAEREPANMPAPTTQAGGASYVRPATLTEVLPIFQAAHHIAILGDTGSGKTTLAKWLLHHLPGQALIFDPKWKLESPPRWGGLSACKMDSDGGYTGIRRALQALFREFQQRVIISQTQVNATFSPLLVLWDEINDTMESTKDVAGEVLRRGLRIFREYGIKLIIFPQSDQVGPLGLEGHGDAKKNLLWVYLGDDARDLIKRQVKAKKLSAATAQHLQQRAYPAVLVWRGEPYAIDTSEVVEWEEVAVDSGRAWAYEAAPATAGAAEGQEEPAATAEQQRQIAQVAAALALNPTIKNRELARLLYPGTDGGGSYSVNAKRIRELVQPLVDGTVTVLHEACNTADVVSPVTSNT